MYLVYDGNDLNSTQNNVDTKSKLPVITIYVRMMFLILCNILFYVTCVINHKYISAIFTCVNYIDYNVQMFQDGPDQVRKMSSKKLMVSPKKTGEKFGAKYQIKIFESYSLLFPCGSLGGTIVILWSYVILLFVCRFSGKNPTTPSSNRGLPIHLFDPHVPFVGSSIPLPSVIL